MAAGSTWRYLANGTQPGHRVARVGVQRRDLVPGRRAAGLRRRGRSHGDPVRAEREPEVRHDATSGSQFTVNPSELGTVTLQLKRDDGAVVYLNGTEIVRSNMPAGTITLDDARERRRQQREPVLLLHDPGVGVRQRDEHAGGRGPPGRREQLGRQLRPLARVDQPDATAYRARRPGRPEVPVGEALREERERAERRAPAPGDEVQSESCRRMVPPST